MEPKMRKFSSEAYAVILDSATEEILQFTGGRDEWKTWFQSTNPAHSAMLDAFLNQCLDAAEASFPVFCFETLVACYVSQIRHVHCLWEHRDELPPGVAERLPFVN